MLQENFVGFGKIDSFSSKSFGVCIEKGLLFVAKQFIYVTIFRPMVTNVSAKIF
jgi:hypothetical protein